MKLKKLFEIAGEPKKINFSSKNYDLFHIPSQMIVINIKHLSETSWGLTFKDGPTKIETDSESVIYIKKMDCNE